MKNNLIQDGDTIKITVSNKYGIFMVLVDEDKEDLLNKIPGWIFLSTVVRQSGQRQFWAKCVDERGTTHYLHNYLFDYKRSFRKNYDNKGVRTDNLLDCRKSNLVWTGGGDNPDLTQEQIERLRFELKLIDKRLGIR